MQKWTSRALIAAVGAAVILAALPRRIRLVFGTTLQCFQTGQEAPIVRESHELPNHMVHSMDSSQRFFKYPARPHVCCPVCRPGGFTSRYVKVAKKSSLADKIKLP